MIGMSFLKERGEASHKNFPFRRYPVNTCIIEVNIYNVCTFYWNSLDCLNMNLSSEECQQSLSMKMKQVVKICSNLFEWYSPPCPRLLLLTTPRDLYFPWKLTSTRKKIVWINLPICSHQVITDLYWIIFKIPLA